VDSQVLFNIIVGVSGAFGGWILKVIWDSIKQVDADVKLLGKEMHNDFVRRDDFKASMVDMKDDMREGFKEVKELLGAVFKRLEGKADR
jgi:hypothetical protein